MGHIIERHMEFVALFELWQFFHLPGWCGAITMIPDQHKSPFFAHFPGPGPGSTRDLLCVRNVDTL